MLEKHLYDSWKSIMELYMMNRPHGRMILASVEKGPLVWPTITVDGVTRPKEYTELTPAETIQADCDIKAINIILQGLPTEIYALVSQHRVAKDIWEKIKLLMQGTSLTKQERECKLYDEFDKFTYKKGESLHEYYLRFTLLLNDMNIYKMPLEQFQVNTKFLNTLPAEWSKFVTDVKLVKDLHTTNVDQIHAHLEQHERHANEHSYQNSQHQQFVSPYQSSQYGSPFESQQYSINQSPTPHSITYPPNNYQTSVHHNVFSPSSSIPQIEYSPTVNQQSKFSQLDSGLTIPVFKHGDDPIDAINHVILSPPLYTTNNQLRNSSNPRQQATINNGRVTLQPIQGRQTSFAAGTLRTYTPGASGSNSGKQRMVICYNCKGEGQSLKRKLANYTKNNLEKKSVNDTLTAELERYKEQVKVLKEGQNIDLRSKDNISDTCAQSVEIDLLKQTLLEHLKEKESLLQTVTLLKNDFKKEELRKLIEKNLEKQIKTLDNIVFKRKFQSVQTVHMLDDTQFFFDNTIPQSRFQYHSICRKSAVKPNLYVGDIIEKKKQVDTTPIDYAALNQLYKDFPTRFVPQTELSAEQAFWSQNSVNSSEPNFLIRPHVEKGPTHKLFTEGSWGFEHTKACFRDEIIPFVKALKDLFSTFNQHLVDELSEVQNVFYQMEQAVEQHRIESKTFEEIFQRENSVSNQSVPSFDQLFELNELKPQSREDLGVKQSTVRVWELVPTRQSYGDYLRGSQSEIDEWEDFENNALVYVASGWVVDKDNPNHVYKLKKSLYGLKQAQRAWYDMLSYFLISKNFQGRFLPTKQLNAVKKDLSVSKENVHRGYGYEGFSIDLTAYADADHAGDQIHTLALLEVFNFWVIRLLAGRSKRVSMADIFTSLLANRIEFLINKLGMRSFTPETLKQLADEVDE
ncbi:retrovirus-related pol polyprotein from transposon TNT 1-94 [Tanacetum coccineum]|uniref:Retrovirus-related pol polyprotein from transposon TNT 1-94 n=1 Tax=Tanacetum coccineum TaxID=301880 RepID=A0ABQ5EY77_9ASTR